MSHSDSPLLKRKTDSSLDMGQSFSTLFTKKPRHTDDAETPSSPKTADKAEEKPSPSKIVDDVVKTEPSSPKIVDDSEVKREDAPASPRIAAGSEEKDESPESPKREAKESSSSTVTAEVKDEEIAVNDETKQPPSSPRSVDDDGPPALSRQDGQPAEELKLDDTPECSPAPSPAKRTEKAAKEDKKEEVADDVSVEKVVQRQASSSSLTRRNKKKTIADMGYCFREGKLRTIDGDAGFTFTTQKAYEELGDLIGDYVYELMEQNGLKKQYLEVGRNRRFYFVSPGYERKARILVLIHGSGVVKAGQWARKLIINESLDRGTQLNYIKRGLDNGWGVIVLNFNEHCVGKEDRCHAPDAHGREEWLHALEDTRDDAEIVVVAHSYGGSIISDAVRRMHRANDDRVLCVALTDSWFSEGSDVFAVNWNTMKKKLHRSGGTWQMYSGDNTHEGTSASCLNACFALLEAVSEETEIEEFHDLLEASQQIVLAEFKERIRKKREAEGDSTSVKSLELGEDKMGVKEVQKEKGDDKDDEKKKKDEDWENKKEEAKKSEDKLATGDAATEATEEKKVELEVVEAVGEAPQPERNPSDNEDDSDEGVEKDAPTPDKSDIEN